MSAAPLLENRAFPIAHIFPIDTTGSLPEDFLHMPIPRSRSPQRAIRVLSISACVLILIALMPLANAAIPSQKPVNLKCDTLSTPIGLDTPHPQFSWQLQDDRFAAKQTAYQLQVATQPSMLAAGKSDIWDSGRVASEQSVGVAYAGPVLKPEQRYYWRVRVWDKDGNTYPASDVTWWETGLMSPAAWRGKWIGFEAAGRAPDPRIRRDVDHQPGRSQFHARRYTA